jgi:hypothetical protein
MKHDSRITPREWLDDGRDEGRGVGGAASDPNFPGCGVCEKLDVLHRLVQVVEYGRSAIEQRTTTCRRLDAAGVAIEQTYAHCAFQLRNRSGNGGLGHIENGGRLVHAAGPRDSHQDMEIAQFHVACDVFAELHFGTYA